MPSIARRSHAALAALATGGVLVLGACRGEEAPGEEPRTPARELQVERERGAAFFLEDDFESAREPLRWVCEQPEATVQDWVNLACVELQDAHGDEAEVVRALREARAEDDRDPAPHYCEGVLAMRQGRFGAAADCFGRAVERAPDDAASRMQYADALESIGREDEARRELQTLLDAGLSAGGYHLTAMYRLSTLHLRSRDVGVREQGIALRKRHQELIEAEVLSSLTATTFERGVFGQVRLEQLQAWAGEAGSGASPSFSGAQLLGEALGRARAGTVADVDGDERLDLVVCAEGGVGLLRSREDGSWGLVELDAGQGDRVQAVDLVNGWDIGWTTVDPSVHARRLSLLLNDGTGLRLLVPDARGEYHPQELPVAEARDVLPVDFDHDGDLDLLLAVDGGLSVLRNDGPDFPRGGPAPDGPLAASFRRLGEGDDEASLSGLPRGDFDWVHTEDFDGDNDVDFLVGGARSPTLIVSSLRHGRFEVLDGETSGLPPRIAHRPALVDLDHDGRVDVWVAGRGFFSGRGEGRFEPGRVPGGVDGVASCAFVDLDQDGWLDRVEGLGDQAQWWRGSLLAAASEAAPLPVRAFPDEAPLLIDLDGDADLDLVGPAERGLAYFENLGEAPEGAARLELRGGKDNSQAIGAIVEMRAGRQYRRSYYRGQPLSVGMGRPLDVLRIRWPNGVRQSSAEPYCTEDGVGLIQHEEGRLIVHQKVALISSCPFLYTFDGRHHQFITDILGITPLGLPMGTGQLVTPDHDELVRIESERLAPVDGEYRLWITEELREATYLDHAELWVVDHDPEVLIHPEERFCFPPFPERTIHALRAPRNLVRVTGSDGRDWTEELAAADEVHAVPFELAPTQFLGLATPHHLDLQLPPEVATAERVRLLMTGWFYWTDASVNIAAGHDAQIEFVPPTLSVPDADGAFQPRGPPLGFPAGKTKTMVLDIGDRINREDLRLRLSSTLRLYWDHIQVAVDAGEEPYELRRLPVASAELSYRGFSRPIPVERPDQVDRFDFESLMEEAPWDQHQGWLTRYGSVEPLLEQVDDRYAVFSAGDAIELRFDASSVTPAPPGRARTFLLAVDGWAKDADPNTVHGGQIEPLPFHGMSRYPYPPDESPFLDAANAGWLERWNTRPGRRLVPDLVVEGGRR